MLWLRWRMLCLLRVSVVAWILHGWWLLHGWLPLELGRWVGMSVVDGGLIASSRELLRIAAVQSVNAIRSDLALESLSCEVRVVGWIDSRCSCVWTWLASNVTLRWWSRLDSTRDEVEWRRTIRSSAGWTILLGVWTDKARLLLRGLLCWAWRVITLRVLLRREVLLAL